eukprot:g6655.t1
MKSIEYPPAFVVATFTSALVTVCSLYYDKNATLTSKLQDTRRQVLSIVSVLFVGYVVTLAYRNEIHKSLEWHSSPIDWCEKNYEVTPYVVEFWNTLSSSALCVGAIVATIKTRSFGKRESGWIFWNISFFCIGLGSMYFHATLSAMGQVLDEMPIIWSAMFMSLIIAFRKHEFARRFLLSPPFFVMLLVLTPLIAVLYPTCSHIIVLASFPYGIYIVGHGFRNCRDKKGIEAAKNLFVFGVQLALVGAVCWILDRSACDYFVPYLGFNPQLHAFWHILVASGAYCAMVVSQYFSARLDGYENARVVTDRFGIPGIIV